MFWFVLVLSCGQQQTKMSSKLLSASERKSLSTKCEDANFHTDVLTKNGLIKIFECLSWKEKYPQVSRWLISIDETDLNNSLATFNQTFFRSTATRNKFLDFAKEYILEDVIKEWHTLAKNLSEESLPINFLDIISQNNQNFPEIKQQSLLVVGESLGGISQNLQDKIQITFREIKNDKPLYSKLPPLLQVILSEYVKDPKSFFKMFSSLVSPDEELILGLQTMEGHNFQNLLYYPRSRENVQQTAARLQQIIVNNEYACSDTTGIYELNQVKELTSRMKDLRALSHEDFLFSLYDLRLKFTLFNNICYYKELDDLVKVFMDDLIEFSIDPVGFNTLKRVALGSDDDFSLFNYISSDFFSTYKKLVEHDTEETLMNLLPALQAISINDLKLFSNILGELSLDLSFAAQFKLYWSEFSTKEKNTILHFVRDSIFSKGKITSSLMAGAKLLNLYPNLIKDIYKNTEKAGVIRLLKKFSEASQKEGFRNDLSHFVSDENFGQLLRILGQTKDEKRPETDSDVSVARVQQDKGSAIKSCLNDLFEKVKGEYNFWTLLEKYPETCQRLPEQKKEMAHLVFEWTFDIDRIFLKFTGQKFAVDYGVISPQMMRYYHELIHLTNRHLQKNNPNYVLETIDRVRKHLFDFNLIGVLDSFVTVANNTIVGSRKETDQALKLLVEADFSQVDSSIKNLLLSLNTKEQKPSSYTYTKKLNTRVGEKNTSSTKEILSFAKDTKKLLLKENDGQNLLSSVIDLLHPKSGVPIPMFRDQQRIKKFNLQEFLLFLYDASSGETAEEVLYRDEKGSQVVSLTLIQRLELVIREIGFLNNFYGAFFINKIAKAKNYTRQIIKMKKTLRVIDKSSGLFRKLGIFPKETQWAFKNIDQAYDSLWQLNDGKMRYGDLIQSILATTVTSSPVNAQSFSALRRPDTNRVEDHNGKFIRLLTKNSILTHLSFFLRENFSRDEIENSESISMVSENFLKFISQDDLLLLMRKVLEHENFEAILEDLVTEKDFSLDGLSHIFKLLADMSLTFKNEELGNLTGAVMALMDHYFIVMNIDKKDSLRGLVSQFASMESEKRVSALKVLKYFPRKVSVDRLQIEQLVAKINFYTKMGDNNSGFFREFTGDKDFSVTPILKMLRSTHLEQGNFNYFYHLFEVLGERDAEGSMLKHGLDKLFNEKSNQLESFLSDIFTRFEDQSSSKKL